MRSYELLLERNLLSWNPMPNIGWWLDKAYANFYHGTHKKNIQDILEHGILAPEKGRSAGYVSLALEPNTAFGYASMHGGETEFRAAGQKAFHVPKEDRVVFIIQMSKDYFLESMEPTTDHSIGLETRLKNKEEYINWKKHGGSDIQYYELTEIRISKKIDPKYILGYTIKN